MINYRITLIDFLKIQYFPSLYSHLIETWLCPPPFSRSHSHINLFLHPSLWIYLDLWLELTIKMQQKSLQRSTSEKSKLAPMRKKDHIKREAQLTAQMTRQFSAAILDAAPVDLQDDYSNRTSPRMEQLTTGCWLHSSAQLVKFQTAPTICHFFLCTLYFSKNLFL